MYIYIHTYSVSSHCIPVAGPFNCVVMFHSTFFPTCFSVSCFRWRNGSISTHVHVIFFQHGHVSNVFECSTGQAPLVSCFAAHHVCWSHGNIFLPHCIVTVLEYWLRRASRTSSTRQYFWSDGKAKYPQNESTSDDHLTSILAPFF